MSGWNSQAMFDLYVYDYLRKNNMLETAEDFRRENNLKIDPDTRPAIDTPDGFLRQWWLASYQMQKANPRDLDMRESVSLMVDQMIEGINTNMNSTGSMGPPISGPEQLLELMGASSASKQEDQSATKLIPNYQGNAANVSGQGVDTSVGVASRIAEFTSDKRGRKSTGKSKPKNGKSGLAGGGNANSGISLTKEVSDNNNVIFVSAEDDAKKENASISDDLPGSAATAKKFKVRQVAVPKKVE